MENKVISIERFKRRQELSTNDSSIIKLFGKKYIMKKYIINRYKALGYILFTTINVVVSWFTTLYIINNIFN